MNTNTNYPNFLDIKMYLHFYANLQQRSTSSRNVNVSTNTFLKTPLISKPSVTRG